MVKSVLMRTPMKVVLSEEDRVILNRWVKSRAVGEKQKLRARIVLLAADGIASQVIMETLKISAWRTYPTHRRFATSYD
jgi:hypothetical protein